MTETYIGQRNDDKTNLPLINDWVKFSSGFQVHQE